MAEYGNYKEEIKTLGDLRKFVNETLKGLEDEYTFSIDDDFTGVDITLCANCDVSYSERDFYWSTNSNWYIDLDETISKKIKLERKAKAFDIIKEKNVDLALVKMASSVEQYNYVYIHEHNLDKKLCLTQEEFDLLKEVFKDE